MFCVLQALPPEYVPSSTLPSQLPWTLTALLACLASGACGRSSEWASVPSVCDSGNWAAFRRAASDVSSGLLLQGDGQKELAHARAGAMGLNSSPQEKKATLSSVCSLNSPASSPRGCRTSPGANSDSPPSLRQQCNLRTRLRGQRPQLTAGDADPGGLGAGEGGICIPGQPCAGSEDSGSSLTTGCNAGQGTKPGADASRCCHHFAVCHHF